MNRLFVAIRPPRVIREHLLALMGGVGGARWQSEHQLHLTLRFIGEVNRHQAEDIGVALNSVHHPKFDVQLNGIGIFERKGRPVALWAGVAPQEPLKALHKKVDQACVRAGLVPEGRSYQPHITLARLGRTTDRLDHFFESTGSLTSPGFPVDAFDLYESTLTQEGSIYSMLHRYPLS